MQHIIHYQRDKKTRSLTVHVKPKSNKLNTTIQQLKSDRKNTKVKEYNG